MDTEENNLNRRDRRRLSVARRVAAGKMTVAEAAQALELSERQMWRIMSAYRRRAVAGLRHGNRGRTPAHALRAETRDRVLEVARSMGEDYTHSQLREVLRTQEGIDISLSSVRNILAEAGIRHRPGRRPQNAKRR